MSWTCPSQLKKNISYHLVVPSRKQTYPQKIPNILVNTIKMVGFFQLSYVSLLVCRCFHDFPQMQFFGVHLRLLLTANHHLHQSNPEAEVFSESFPVF